MSSNPYPMDDESRALRWRHQRAMRLLEHDPHGANPCELLLAVVHPGPELLAASLEAVRAKGKSFRRLNDSKVAA